MIQARNANMHPLSELLPWRRWRFSNNLQSSRLRSSRCRSMYAEGHNERHRFTQRRRLSLSAIYSRTQLTPDTPHLQKTR